MKWHWLTGLLVQETVLPICLRLAKGILVGLSPPPAARATDVVPLSATFPLTMAVKGVTDNSKNSKHD
jgi:hypothetical protein